MIVCFKRVKTLAALPQTPTLRPLFCQAMTRVERRHCDENNRVKGLVFPHFRNIIFTICDILVCSMHGAGVFSGGAGCNFFQFSGVISLFYGKISPFSQFFSIFLDKL